MERRGDCSIPEPGSDFLDNFGERGKRIVLTFESHSWQYSRFHGSAVDLIVTDKVRHDLCPERLAKTGVGLIVICWPG